MTISFSTAWQENKSIILFLVLMAFFRSSIADWNDVPTGSMKPTILEGDRILINKLAYDLRIPFTHVSLMKISNPSRGDIIIFDAEAAGKRLVKRVVGIPGDVIEMKNNILYINGQKLAYENISSTLSTIDRSENLLGVDHLIRINALGSRLSNFGRTRIPADHYFALGDNRDNSSDSRIIGLIPRKEIIGRSRTTVLSFNDENSYIPRSDRFLHPL